MKMSVETAENIVDAMYQERMKSNEVKTENGTIIDLGKNIEFTDLERASVILLREEISANRELKNSIPKSVIREKIEEYKKYGLKRNIGSFIDMSTYKAITYEEALDELKEELLGEKDE